MTLAELQAKRDAVVQSIGTLRVQYGEHSIEFVQDKQRELALLDAEIAALQSPQPKQFVIQTSRGL